MLVLQILSMNLNNIIAVAGVKNNNKSVAYSAPLEFTWDVHYREDATLVSKCRHILHQCVSNIMLFRVGNKRRDGPVSMKANCRLSWLCAWIAEGGTLTPHHHICPDGAAAAPSVPSSSVILLQIVPQSLGTGFYVNLNFQLIKFIIICASFVSEFIIIVIPGEEEDEIIKLKYVPIYRVIIMW